MILATIVIAVLLVDVGAIPGILRAYLGTSEVIVTIMMNYIVLYVGNAFIHAFPKDFMQSTDSTIRVGANATYQTPWLAELTGNSRMNIWYFLCYHCRCSHLVHAQENNSWFRNSCSWS